MKPSGILLFFVSVFTLLLAGAIYFPEEGIPIAANLRLQFISKKDIFPDVEDRHVNIATILKQQKYITDSVLMAIANGKTDELKIPGMNTDSLINSITPIEYPEHDSALLYSFFKSLDENAVTSVRKILITKPSGVLANKGPKSLSIITSKRHFPGK